MDIVGFAFNPLIYNDLIHTQCASVMIYRWIIVGGILYSLENQRKYNKDGSPRLDIWTAFTGNEPTFLTNVRFVGYGVTNNANLLSAALRIRAFLVLTVLSIVYVDGARFGFTIKMYPIRLAGNFQKTAGEVFHVGEDLAVIKDNDHAVTIKKGEWDSSWTTAVEVRLTSFTPMLEVELTNGLPRETILALAQKLVGKRLPYGAFLCNEVHYIRYILGGEVYRSWYRRDCLTNLPLDGVTPQQINTPQFSLKDDNNRYFPVDSLPPFRSHSQRTSPQRRATRRA